MLVVVGLGNPGTEYDGTRHNVGFAVVDCLARRHKFPAFRRWKGGVVCRGELGGREALLVKPMTYMNLSGDCVQAVLAYYRVDPGDLVVVHDDLDFDPGQVRVKSGGGHGGHNGLRSIVEHIGGDFARVRVGIGKPPSADRGVDHVLAKLGTAARQPIEDAVARAADAVECIVDRGLQAAMNRFNQKETTGELPAPSRPPKK